MGIVTKYMFIPLLLLIILLGGERTAETIQIAGTLVDSIQKINIEDVTVELYTRKIENGIYSANYDLASSINTSADGRFSFELSNRTWASIKLFFLKEGYFNWEYEIEGDILKRDMGIDEVYNMQAKAWLQFSIKNGSPTDSNDLFDFRLINAPDNCQECCSSDNNTYLGMLVNEDFICLAIGHQDVIVQWNKIKADVQTGGTDRFFASAFDTTLIEYVY